MVARSNAEVEFKVAYWFCEVMWIKRLLEQFKILKSSLTKIYSYNTKTTSIAHNPVLHDRTKHVEVDKHFIEEKLDNRLTCMPYIPTTKQIVDILTKGLHKKQFDSLIGKLENEEIFKLV